MNTRQAYTQAYRAYRQAIHLRSDCTSQTTLRQNIVNQFGKVGSAAVTSLDSRTTRKNPPHEKPAVYRMLLRLGQTIERAESRADVHTLAECHAILSALADTRLSADYIAIAILAGQNSIRVLHNRKPLTLESE